jgi:hypothetical protein
MSSYVVGAVFTTNFVADISLGPQRVLFLQDHIALQYQMTETFPRRNFAVCVKLTNNDTNDGTLEIDFGATIALVEGEHPPRIGNHQSFTISSYAISYNLVYDDGTEENFPIILDFNFHPAFNSSGENEICFVIDNDVYQEFSVFLNGTKIQYTAFSHTKDVDIMNASGLLTIRSYVMYLELNQFVVYDTIPSRFLVDLTAITNVFLQPTGYPSQRDYLIIGNAHYNAQRAFNKTYDLNSPDGMRDWVAPKSYAYMWAWVDLGNSRTINRLRLWQNDITNSLNTISNFSLFMTNDASLTSGLGDASQHFVKFSSDKAQIGWYYTDNGGKYRTTSVFGGANDPTLSRTKTASTGFHEFRFDNFNPYKRTGRYCRIIIWRNAIPGQPRLFELKLLGY